MIRINESETRLTDIEAIEGAIFNKVQSCGGDMDDFQYRTSNSDLGNSIRIVFYSNVKKSDCKKFEKSIQKVLRDFMEDETNYVYISYVRADTVSSSDEHYLPDPKYKTYMISILACDD